MSLGKGMMKSITRSQLTSNMPLFCRSHAPMRLLVTLLSFLLAFGSAQGQEFSHPFGKGDQAVLSQPLQWVSAPPAAASTLPADFFGAPGTWVFLPYSEKTTLPTSASSDVWLRFTLAATAEPQSWMIRIPSLATNKVSLYEAVTSNFWSVQSAGAAMPHNAWSRNTRTPSFEVVTSAIEKTYFVRLENHRPLTERPEMMSQSDFADSAARAGTLLGIMLGIFVVLMLACVAAFAVARSTVFISLAGFVAATLVYYLVQMGYGDWRVWPGNAYLNQVMPWTAPLFALAAGCWFFAQASHAKDISQLAYRLLCLLAIFSLGLIFFKLTGASQIERGVLNTWTSLVLVLVVVSMLGLSFRGVRGNVWLLGGLIPIATAGVLGLAPHYGWATKIELMQTVGVFLAMFGLAWLFVAVVWRCRTALLSSELATALNESDATSGLIQAHVALTRLPQMLRRATRLKLGCGVIMLRWLNYPQVNTAAGLEKQNDMLKHLGHLLNRVARDIDTAARLDDSHFLIMVEGPVSRSTLSLLSTQILTACMRASEKFGEPNPFTFHVAIWQATLMPTSADEVMEALKTRLNQMSYGTKRPVQFVDAASSDSSQEAEHEWAQRRDGVMAKIDAVEASPRMRAVLVPKKINE